MIASLVFEKNMSPLSQIQSYIQASTVICTVIITVCWSRMEQRNEGEAEITKKKADFRVSIYGDDGGRCWSEVVVGVYRSLDHAN